MVVWDRRRGDGRYDAGMSNMTDLEFLLQLYRTIPMSYHLGRRCMTTSSATAR